MASIIEMNTRLDAARDAARQRSISNVREESRPTVGPNYAGRLLCLNPEKLKSFQCGGFILGPKRPSAVVPSEAQMLPIHLALLDGRLLDITGQGEIRTDNGTLEVVAEEETPKKVYLTQAPNGEFVAIGVSDPEQQIEFDRQLQEHGSIALPPAYYDQIHIKETGKKEEKASIVKRGLLWVAEKIS